MTFSIHSLLSSHHSWITEAFQKYHLHASVSGDVAHLRHIESRYLGTATLQLGAQCFPHASFYEITESEISEQGLDRKHVRSPSTQDVTPPFQDQLDDHDHHLVDGGGRLPRLVRLTARRQVLRKYPNANTRSAEANGCSGMRSASSSATSAPTLRCWVAAMLVSASQKASSSATLVRWPARLKLRLVSRTAFSRRLPA